MNQRRDNDEGVTEDDVDEIKHDISALRYELLDVFRNNGMKIPSNYPGRRSSRQSTHRLLYTPCSQTCLKLPDLLIISMLLEQPKELIYPQNPKGNVCI